MYVVVVDDGRSMADGLIRVILLMMLAKLMVWLMDFLRLIYNGCWLMAADD